MPSIQCNSPSMVDKGIQCTLLSSPVKSFQLSFPCDSTSFNDNDCHHPSQVDRYNARISGDVYNMSMGPTIIYKLDPETTREILLGNSNGFDRLQFPASGSSSNFIQTKPRRKVSFKENDIPHSSNMNAAYTQIVHEIKEAQQLRVLRRVQPQSVSHLTEHEIKMSNSIVQTLFTYGIGGVACNFIFKHRNQNKASD